MLENINEFIDINLKMGQKYNIGDDEGDNEERGIDG